MKSVSLTFKVHIPNQFGFSCKRIMDMVDAYVNHSCTFFDHISCNQLWDTWNHQHIFNYPGQVVLGHQFWMISRGVHAQLCMHKIEQNSFTWIFLDTPTTDQLHPVCNYYYYYYRKEIKKNKPTKNNPPKVVPWAWFWFKKDTQPISNFNCHGNPSTQHWPSIEDKTPFLAIYNNLGDFCTWPERPSLSTAHIVGCISVVSWDRTSMLLRNSS